MSALQKGCYRAVVDEAQYAIDDRFMLVSDVLDTLQRLAAYHRKQMKIPVIGITGTNGKTTTKELIACVLQKKYKVLYTQGNLNNHIGVPLTLLRLNSSRYYGGDRNGGKSSRRNQRFGQYCSTEFRINH